MPRVAFAASEGPWPPPRLHLFPRTGKINGWMLRRCNTVRAWDTGDLLPYSAGYGGTHVNRFPCRRPGYAVCVLVLPLYLADRASLGAGEVE